MSFIYDDKKLINDLIKSGLESEARIKISQNIKPGPFPENPFAAGQPLASSGPSAPPVSKGDDATAATYANIALKLLDEIERAATPGEPTISSNLPGSADLIDMQLESLGTLIRFLALSEIMVDFKRIAFKKDDPQAPKNNRAYELYSLSANAFFAPQNQDIPQFDFYINKDLLQQYLVSLQATAHKDENKFLENRLKILIDEARKNGIKIDPNYKPPGKPGEKPGEKPGTQPGAQNIKVALMPLLQLLPLSRDRIDFVRINNFFKKYNEFLATFPDTSSPVATNIAEGERLIAKAMELTVPQQQFILISNSSMDKISFMLGPDWKRKYLGFIETLKRVVTATGSIIAQLYNNYGEDARARDEIFRDNPDQLTKLFQQASSGSSCVMDANMRDLQHLEDEGMSRLSVK
jgi:hypothetical protein